MHEKKTITVQAVINAPVEQVWKLYTEPEHVMKWNNASNDWHTPRAENDLKVGGKFLYRMEAKDGSSGFDFDGTYEQVKANELIVYSLTDGREVEVVFTNDDEDDDDARRVMGLLQVLHFVATLLTFPLSNGQKSGTGCSSTGKCFR